MRMSPGGCPGLHLQQCLYNVVDIRVHPDSSHNYIGPPIPASRKACACWPGVRTSLCIGMASNVPFYFTSYFQ